MDVVSIVVSLDISPLISPRPGVQGLHQPLQCLYSEHLHVLISFSKPIHVIYGPLELASV